MTKTYQLISGQNIHFDYQEIESYFETYYSMSKCTNVIHTDGDVITPLEGDVVTYKDGWIKVYSGMDMIARVKEVE